MSERARRARPLPRARRGRRAGRDRRTSRRRCPRRSTPLLNDGEIERYSRQLRAAGVERAGAARAARRERAGDRRRRARLAGRAVPRGRGRRPARASSTTTTSSSPTCTASRCTSRPTSGVPKAESAAAKLRFLNPDIVVEAYRVRVDETNVARAGRGPGPRDRLHRLVRDPLRRQRRLLRRRHRPGRGRRGRLERARDDDPARARPPATAARSRPAPTDAPTCAEAGIAGPGGGRDRLAAGARGAQAARPARRRR